MIKSLLRFRFETLFIWTGATLVVLSLFHSYPTYNISKVELLGIVFSWAGSIIINVRRDGIMTSLKIWLALILTRRSIERKRETVK